VTHYCPECEEQKNAVDIEEYVCSRCKDQYCVHFMKTIKAPQQTALGKWTPGEYICWVCGSEKRKEESCATNTP